MLNREQRRHPRVKGQPISSSQKEKNNVDKGKVKPNSKKESTKSIKKSEHGK